MMLVLRFIFMVTLLAVSAYAARALLRKVNRKSWQSATVEHIAAALPYLLLAGAVFWGAGSYLNIAFMKMAGATWTAFLIMASAILLITLPLSMVLIPVFKKDESDDDVSVDLKKRTLLKGAVGAAPLLFLGSAAKGVADSFSSVRLPLIDIEVPGLPDALEGKTILHLSDLHLGYYFGLDHLENTLLAAEKFDPDLVAVTGDIADDLTLMTDAMNLIGQYKPNTQKFASIGNHEYFRGINDAIRQIEKGPVPLLKNDNLSTSVAGVPVVVGGADDPAYLHGDISGFLDDSLSKTFAGAKETPFRLLLSHRPSALDVASKHNVNLVLSGHTHAGQLGINRQSLFSYMNPEAYLWGVYQKDNARLYTSAGMGHWFPFRLGAPLEAPLIRLRKA